MIVDQFALVAASAFAGACAYINIVEQPARLDLEPSALLAEWKRSYHRGTIMQVSVAIAAAALGLVTFGATRDWRWLCGVAFLLAIAPYTLVGIMPTNRRLTAMAVPTEHDRVQVEVRRWGRLHAVRTALGIAAVLAFMWAAR